MPEGAGIAPSSGRIQVQTRPGTEVKYGDMLRITGEPQTPPEEETFSYREYLARQGIQTLVAFPKIEVISTGTATRSSPLYILSVCGATRSSTRSCPSRKQHC